MGAKETIYLDHAATTPVDPEVMSAMEPFFTDRFENPSAAYGAGHDVRKAVDDARSTVANFLGCSFQEVIFTGGGTESDNLAILGASRFAEKGNIVTTAIEHPAVFKTCHSLADEGFEVRVCGVAKNGIIDPAAVAELVDGETALVSVILASNEIGTIQPVAEVAAAVNARNPKTLVHTDACQAADAMPLKVEDLGVDLLTMNAGKIYGPKGVGALYVKRGTHLKPLMFGGEQERSLRPGTENVPGIVGFAKAVELAEARYAEDGRREQELRDLLIDGLLGAIEGAELNGDREQRLPKNVNLFFPGIDGDALLVYLDKAGIQASLGSACAAGSIEPSHVLMAIGRSRDDARRCLRLTLGRGTTREEIDRVISELPGIIEQVSNLK